jgi:hypothetical protein
VNNKTVKWRIIVTLVLSKLTDILLSAKTTLPTLLNSLGAPSWMLGFLVPLRESGSLLPQAMMSAWLTTKSDRRVPWVVSMLIQTSFIAIMILVPLSVLPFFMNENTESYGLLSGAVVLTALIGLSLARAMTSLTMKDIQGEHLNKGKRGNVVGIASMSAGILSLLFALVMMWSGKLNEQVILIIAILCFVAMLLSVMALKSLETDVEVKSKHKDKSTIKNLTTANIKSYLDTFSGELGRFILVRSCFVHTALVAPFYIAWASSLSTQGGIVTLSSFIVAQASATILSSYIWGALSDRNAKLTMQLGAAIVVLICVVTVVVIHFNLAQAVHSFWFIAGYFLISVGHEGARSGRKVYALDIKEGSDRTDFIGKANTAIGVVILTLGAFYSGLTFAGNTVVFSVIILGLLLGLLLSLAMKNEK